MTNRSLIHATFTLERAYPASATRVFAALSDTASRERWGAPSPDEALVFENLDFREGGTEISRCGPKGNLMFRVETHYLSIAPDRHIVFTENVSGPEGRLSASLLTFEILADGDATRMHVTGQIASFAGEQMIRGNQNGLAAALENLETELKGISE
jgi:uncharacterized protein YndB with AHSA1/START domain